MNVYFKFLRLFLVLMVGVFFLVGSGGGGGDDTKAPIDNPETITVLDSTKETISYNEIQTILENNETTYSKSFTLDDKKTEVKISFDLLENNITKDVQIDVERLDYKEDVITAKLLKLLSSVPLKNLEIEIEDNEVVHKSQSLNKVGTSKINKIKVSSLSEASVFAYEDNFYKFVKSIKLEQLNGNYNFSIETTQKLLRMGFITNYDNNTYSATLLNSKSDIIRLFDLDKVYSLSFGRRIKFPSIDELIFVKFKTYKMVTDFIGLNKKYTIVEKKLSETRATTSDILNNFIDTVEQEDEKETLDDDKVELLNEIVTHRITDFDKLLTNTTTIPPEWRVSDYGQNILNDNGRMPLILVHGWDGTISLISRETRRDPTKLLLWDNAEYHYWHNFLAYYLTSEALQKKYHVYLYRYTSYKHVAYNAKMFKELLNEVSSSTDLGKGFQKDKGITIMAHSMGGMVSRAMIEEWEGLGKNAKKLKKLITLDTPHHGSVGSMNKFLTNSPKDLNTHGAMDLNYDNFDSGFNAKELDEYYNQRRSKNGLDKFDEFYCNKLKYSTRKECMEDTSNPYMKYVNKIFEDNNETYSKKYIFYTAWNTHNKVDTDLGILSSPFLDFNKNYLQDFNFIDNGDISTASIYIGNFGYSSGGAETVGSSILTSNTDFGKLLNPKDSIFPTYTTRLDNDFYQKKLSLTNACTKYSISVAPDGTPTTVCSNRENVSLSLISDSTGKDHSYGVPYRLFWDYDHETIFNGVSKGGRGSWDDYIKKDSYLDENTDADTLFNSYRYDYIRGANKILHGTESTAPHYANPLKNEPVFMVLERDLVWLDDFDHDGMSNEWEDEHKLDKYDSSDATSDLDGDELSNYNEFINGTNPENNDTDGDGFSDYMEVTINGTDATDSSSHRLYSPIDFSSTRTGQQIVLNWGAVSNTKEYSLKEYKIYLTEDEEYSDTPSLADDTVNYKTTDTLLTLILEEDKTYYFSLVAVQNDNSFSESVLLTVKPNSNPPTVKIELLNENECKTTKLCKLKVGVLSDVNNGATVNWNDGTSTSLGMSFSSDRDYDYWTLEHTYSNLGTYKVVATTPDEENSASLNLVIDGNAISTSEIKKTGQTKSYDSDGNEVTDGSIKDDGFYQAGNIPNYERNNTTEIVIDHITKLQWQDDISTKTILNTWQNVNDYCTNDVTLGNYNNWRLPTRKELVGLSAYGSYYNPSISPVFKNIAPNRSIYWSSTNDARNSNDIAWVVYFEAGITTSKSKFANYYVRCVRREQ